MRRAAALGAAVALTLAAGGARAELRLRPDVGLLGGTLTEWGAPAEAGNAYGLTVGLQIQAFRVGLAVAGVLPDSRSQGQFATWWLEGRWYALRGFREPLAVPLEPYAVVGLGVASEDGADPPRPGAPPVVRWSARGPEPVLMAGVGLHVGTAEGLYVAADVRLYNLSHGGLVVGAGYVF